MNRTETQSAPQDAPIAGRLQELNVLRGFLESARDGRGGFVAICGDPGVGKTRLAHALTKVAVGEGIVCLEGRCLEGAPIPYLPVADILEQAASSVEIGGMPFPSATSLAPLMRIAPGLRAMLGHVDVPEAETQPEHERHALFAAVREFLDALTRTVPLVLLIEDLHWADEASIQLLRYLIRFPASRRLLMVATARPEGPAGGGSSPAAAVVADLERRDARSVLSLEELSVADVTAMIAAICGREPPPSIAASLYRRIGGNPLHVEQVLFQLLSDGRLFDDRDRWVELTSLDALPIPASVRSVVDGRLSSASTECLHLLTIAAVSGERTDYQLLADVSRLEPKSLLAAVESAERSQLITIEQTAHGLAVCFKHDLIRQEILSHVSLPRAQSVHLAIAEAIERLFDVSTGEHDTELALHYLRSSSTAHRDKALSYTMSAAGRAARATAFEDAVRLYAEALQLIDPSDRHTRCTLLLKLGEARKRVSDSDEARQAYDEAAAIADELEDARSFATAALGYSRSWPTVGTVDERAVDLLTRALNGIPEDDIELRARLLARLALQTLYSGSPDDVVRRARDAVECSRRSGDRVTLARALQVLHAALWEPRYLRERLSAAQDIVELAGEIGDNSVALWGIRPRIADLMELGDIRAAEDDIDAYERGASDTRIPIYLWQAAVRRAMLAIFRGSLDEGEALAQKSLELGRQAEGQNLIAAFGGQLLIIRWQQGRVHELRKLVETSRNNEPGVQLWTAVLAFIDSEAGDRTAARALLEQLAADRFSALTREDSGLVVLILASLICARVGDGIRAEQLFELLDQYRGRNIVVSEGVASVGAAAGYLGMLATTARRFDDAEELLRESVELNAKMGGRPWLARSQYDLARVLLSRRRPGDRREASQLLRAALGIARDGGYRSLQDEIEAFQRAHKRLTTERDDGLTNREREVLVLIASGKSTREISEALVLSERTTARHVTNIYAKIGVRNRVEATAYALRRGLTT